MVKIAVDAMGGDNAPGEIVAGAVMAVQSREDIQIFLIGKEEVVSEELKKHTYKKEQIEVVNATEVIETEEPPVNAIRTKKDSSIVVGMNMVRRGEADAFCSAGSSGAILVGGQVIVGRIKGVERPPMAPLIPTATGVRATIVPTEVPTDKEIKQAAIKIPAKSRLSGRMCKVRLTVASMAPIALADWAKAPARINIQIIKRIFLSEAPPEK